MPITEQHAGRSYPPTETYEVSAAKVAEFARALGDQPGEVAPPTFVAVLAAAAWEQMFDDPELGLALRRIVHGDQKFEWVRPLRVGDRVTATLTIDKVRTRGEADLISASVLIAAADGPVCTAGSTFFHTRAAA